MKQPTTYPSTSSGSRAESRDNLQPTTKRGFTLLELLVVIAIIGILIAMGVASYSAAQAKSRDAKRKADLKAIQNAMEQCYSINSAYPGGTYPNGLSTYMPNGIPVDPKSSSSYTSVTYSTTEYKICADLEGDGIWSPSGTACDFQVTNLQ